MITDPIAAYLVGAAVALVAERMGRWLFNR